MSGKETSKVFEPKVNSGSKTDFNFNESYSGSKFDHYIIRNRNTRIAGIVSSVVLLILSTLFVYPIVRNLNSAEAITPPVDSTTTLTLTSGNSANVSLLVQNSSGTFASSTSSEALTFNVTTNNYTGYEISIKGKDSTCSHLTNTATGDSLTSITASGTSSDFLNGKWGYTLDGGITYLPAPNCTDGSRIEKTEATSPKAKSYTLGLGARADYTTPAGTYTNTFVLTAVGNGTPYTITYDDVTGDSTVANIPPIQQSTEGVSASSIELTSTTPTRTGYTFSKWCEGTVSNNGTTCTGTEYAPGASFGLDRTASSNATTLHAVWTINQYACTKQYQLQNADGTYATAVSDSTEQVNYGATCTYTKTLTSSDTADYAYYNSSNSKTTSGVVGTSGLTLTLEFPRNTYALTVNRNTSFISSVTGAETYRWGENVPITATASSGNEFTSWSQTAGTTSSFGSVTSASTTFTMPKSAATIYADGKTSAIYIQDFTKAMCSSQASSSNVTVTDKRDNNAYTVRYINGNCWMTQNLRYMGDTVGSSSTTSTWYLKSATSNVSSDKTMSMTDLTSGNTCDAARFHNSGNTTTGVWYNYAAASAMTITGSSNENTQTYDICPKGWRLPTSSDQYNIRYYSPQYSPVAGGCYSNGGVGDTGVAYWWSATPRNDLSRYLMQGNASEILTTSTYYARYYGFFVRCIRSS